MTMTVFTEMLKFQLLIEVVIVIVTSHRPYNLLTMTIDYDRLNPRLKFQFLVAVVIVIVTSHCPYMLTKYAHLFIG